MLLTALLQGPAPVFVLVLGLAQSTGRIDLQSALAILAGTGLGAAIGTAVVAWPFGPSRGGWRGCTSAGAGRDPAAGGDRRPAGRLADALVPGNLGEIAYGKKVLLPNMGRHLVAGFALVAAGGDGAAGAGAAACGRWRWRPVLRPAPRRRGRCR